VHSPLAADAAPDFVTVGGRDLDGDPWLDLAEVTPPFGEEADEHPASRASAVLPTATRSVTLLTLVCITMSSKGRCALRLPACSRLGLPSVLICRCSMWAVRLDRNGRTSTGERDLSRSPVESALKTAYPNSEIHSVLTAGDITDQVDQPTEFSATTRNRYDVTDVRPVQVHVVPAGLVVGG